MSGKQYLKNKIPVIFVNLMGMLALALFLFANGNQFQTVLFIFAVWFIILITYLSVVYAGYDKTVRRTVFNTRNYDDTR